MSTTWSVILAVTFTMVGWVVLLNHIDARWEAKPADEKVRIILDMRDRDPHCQPDTDYYGHCQRMYQDRVQEIIDSQ
jgi:hypothetical protein